MNSFAFSSSLCVLIVFFYQVSFQSWIYNQDWSLFIYNKNVNTVRPDFHLDFDEDDLRSEDADDNILDDRDDKSRRLMKSWIWRVNDDAVPPLKSAPDAVRTKITNHD